MMEIVLYSSIFNAKINHLALCELVSMCDAPHPLRGQACKATDHVLGSRTMFNTAEKVESRGYGPATREFVNVLYPRLSVHHNFHYPRRDSGCRGICPHQQLQVSLESHDHLAREDSGRLLGGKPLPFCFSGRLCTHMYKSR